MRCHPAAHRPHLPRTPAQRHEPIRLPAPSRRQRRLTVLAEPAPHHPPDTMLACHTLPPSRLVPSQRLVRPVIQRRRRLRHQRRAVVRELQPQPSDLDPQVHRLALDPQQRVQRIARRRPCLRTWQRAYSCWPPARGSPAGSPCSAPTRARDRRAARMSSGKATPLRHAARRAPASTTPCPAPPGSMVVLLPRQLAPLRPAAPRCRSCRPTPAAAPMLVSRLTWLSVCL